MGSRCESASENRRKPQLDEIEKNLLLEFGPLSPENFPLSINRHLWMRVRTRAGGSGHAPPQEPLPLQEDRRLQTEAGWPVPARARTQEFLRALFLHLKATHASAGRKVSRSSSRIHPGATARLDVWQDRWGGRIHLQVQSFLEYWKHNNNNNNNSAPVSAAELVLTGLCFVCYLCFTRGWMCFYLLYIV